MQLEFGEQFAVAGRGDLAPDRGGESEPVVAVREGGGQDECGDALGVAGGGADGDRAAEGEAGHGEAVEALRVGGGDELVGEVVDGQCGGGAGGVAAAGVVDADDGVAGGEAFQNGAVGAGQAAAGAVGEEQTGAGAEASTGERGLKQVARRHGHLPFTDTDTHESSSACDCSLMLYHTRRMIQAVTSITLAV